MVFRLQKELIFPNPELAEEDGLLAVGGDLSTERLMLAYSNSIFPWPSEGQPITWFSPPERFVLFPEKLRISSSMSKFLKHKSFEMTLNKAFPEVIASCAAIKRMGQRGTWITKAMKEAYIKLHQEGHAWSVETWSEDVLVGGIYGVLVANVFCGESMFSKKNNASKAALIHLIQNHSFSLIDCQVHTNHLESLGAEMISREQYLSYLR
jgi:leucyl/phenylalanyl-tRNA--protein transferase